MEQDLDIQILPQSLAIPHIPLSELQKTSQTEFQHLTNLQGSLANPPESYLAATMHWLRLS